MLLRSSSTVYRILVCVCKSFYFNSYSCSLAPGNTQHLATLLVTAHGFPGHHTTLQHTEASICCKTAKRETHDWEHDHVYHSVDRDRLRTIYQTARVGFDDAFRLRTTSFSNSVLHFANMRLTLCNFELLRCSSPRHVSRPWPQPASAAVRCSTDSSRTLSLSSSH